MRDSGWIDEVAWFDLMGLMLGEGMLGDVVISERREARIVRKREEEEECCISNSSLVNGRIHSCSINRLKCYERRV